MKRLLVAIVVGTLAMGSAAADVMNGSFESGTPNDGASTHWTRLSPGDTSMTGWTVVSGNVDWFSPQVATACKGGRSVDLNGNTNGTISQSLATTPGASYRADFCLAANTNGDPAVKTLDVSATGNATVSYQFDATGHTNVNMGWTRESYSFVATGTTTTLTFASTTTVAAGLNAYGPALDDVSVEELVPPNHQGLWWHSPPGSESGWGINFAHQGDIIFATWFTYGADNEPRWYTIRAQQTAANVYSGPVSSFTGPPFNSEPFPANVNVKTPVGAATITFADDGNSATFTYTVNGITQTKPIVPQQFVPGVPLPVCVWGAQPDLTLATNYQDLWWVTDGNESGWGINFTHQGSIIFATWFTYDSTGKAWWLFSVAAETAVPRVYSGLVRTAMGPPFNADPFDPNAVIRTTAGNATIAFIDGNHAKFDYTVKGVAQTKNLTRQVFAPPGTVCR